MPRPFERSRPPTPSAGQDESSSRRNGDAQSAVIRVIDGNHAVIFHPLSTVHAGQVLTRLADKALSSGTAEAGELEIQIDGRRTSVRVEVLPRSPHGAPKTTDGIEESATEREIRRSQRKLRRLAEHLQTAREEERTRIAREIHDQMGQSLTALKIDLACLRSHLGGDGPAG